MLNKIKTLLFLMIMVTYTFNWISSTYQTPEEKEKELEISEKTNQMLKKSCCPEDFQMLVLTNWDECLKMNTWEFKQHPLPLCRKKLFKVSGPRNEERLAKCTKRKDEWLTCIDDTTAIQEIRLKPEFQNNNTLLKGYPKLKLLCYQRVLGATKCNK